MHSCFQELYGKPVFELFEDSWIVLMVLCFLCQFGELCDVMVDVASFHLQLVEFCRCFVMSVGIVPVLDEVLFELFPHVYVRGGRLLRLFPSFTLLHAYLGLSSPNPHSYSLFRQPRHPPFHHHALLLYHLPTRLPFIVISDSDSPCLPPYLSISDIPHGT